MGKFEEIVTKASEHEQTITIGIATVISILKYGTELLEFLNKKDLTDEQLKEIVNTYGANMNSAIADMNKSVGE